MNFADIVILGVLGFYFWRGWSKGLLRSVFALVALGLCAFYGYAYYQRTHNHLLSLGILFLGPVFLNRLFALICNNFFRREPTPQERFFDEVPKKTTSSLGSRAAGAALSLVWGGLLIGILLYMVFMIPFKMGPIDKVKQEIRGSQTFSFLSEAFGKKFTDFVQKNKPINLQEDVKYLLLLKDTPEYADLMKYPEVQDLFGDPKTMEMIREHDMVGLFHDEKVQDIMANPELIKKFMKLNQKMVEMKEHPEKRSKDADDIHKNY